MTPERARLLGELLTELAADPSGFIPDEAWLPAQQAFALPYIEMAIVRRDANGKVQILLTYRDDKDWTGWHVPGGLWRTKQTVDECLAALARQELGADVQVIFLDKGEWEKWHNHPEGNAISHVAICRGENIVETATVQWFDGVPEGMIDDHGHHAGFIGGVLRQVEEKKLV